MCLALYKPAGKIVAKDNLRAGYYGNCSGCGFCYHDNGNLVVVKGLMTFDEFYEQYKPIELKHDVCAHFRAATHGPVNQANCHPFVMCDGKFAMIHNGIYRVPMKNKALSDTGNFCEQVLEPAILDETYKDKDKIYGNPMWGWGAVVLMSGDGEVIIYNEKMGSWDNGVWYSNRGYQYTDFRVDRNTLAQLDKEHKPEPRDAHVFWDDGD